jgi:hypothetical protein
VKNLVSDVFINTLHTDATEVISIVESLLGLPFTFALGFFYIPMIFCYSKFKMHMMLCPRPSDNAHVRACHPFLASRDSRSILESQVYLGHKETLPFVLSFSYFPIFCFGQGVRLLQLTCIILIASERLASKDLKYFALRDPLGLSS